MLVLINLTHRNIFLSSKLKDLYSMMIIESPPRSLPSLPIETKAQTFRYRSLLSEQYQNVMIWSAYFRNESRTFQSVPKLFKIESERFGDFFQVQKRNQNETEFIFYRVETFPYT